MQQSQNQRKSKNDFANQASWGIGPGVIPSQLCIIFFFKGMKFNFEYFKIYKFHVIPCISNPHFYIPQARINVTGFYFANAANFSPDPNLNFGAATAPPSS